MWTGSRARGLWAPHPPLCPDACPSPLASDCILPKAELPGEGWRAEGMPHIRSPGSAERAGRFGPGAFLDAKAPPSCTQASTPAVLRLTLTVKLTPDVPLSTGSQGKSI